MLLLKLIKLRSLLSCNYVEKISVSSASNRNSYLKIFSVCSSRFISSSNKILLIKKKFATNFTLKTLSLNWFIHSKLYIRRVSLKKENFILSFLSYYQKDFLSHLLFIEITAKNRFFFSLKALNSQQGETVEQANLSFTIYQIFYRKLLSSSNSENVHDNKFMDRMTIETLSRQ